MKSVSESLAGRFDLFDLETLSFAEIHAFEPSYDLLDMIWRGGFPELYANTGINIARFFQSYLSSYLERDVKAFANIADLRDFERLSAPAPCAMHRFSTRRSWRVILALVQLRPMLGFRYYRPRIRLFFSSLGFPIKPNRS